MEKSLFLSITDIKIERDDRVLFSPISLDLFEGELVRIVGENGAGKSSLMRAVLGLTSVSEGKIEYFGDHSYASYELFLKRSLFIGHKTGVKESLTVLENTLMMNSHSSLTDVENALGIIQLHDYIDVPCRKLSAGQIRRVALASLWLSPAQMWFLDEPFAALDREGQVLIEEVMQQHLSKGGAILMTTHQPLLSLTGREISLTGKEVLLH